MRPGALAAALWLAGAPAYAQPLNVDGSQRASLADASRELTRRRPAVTACLDRARANDPERLRALRTLLVVLRVNRAGRATVVELHPPLLTPGLAGSAGYVPNVVYTCGALAHGDVLVLPHGIGDRTIAITTVSISELVGSLCPTGV